MLVSVSLVIGDLSPEGIRLTVSEDMETIRRDLRDFYNQAVEDGGLDEEAPTLDADAPLSAIEIAIFNWVGRKVVVFPAVDLE